MYRSPKLLKACRDLPCQRCDREDGTVVAAHSNQLRDGKGRGIKAHDYRVAALCSVCHFEIDQGKTLLKFEKSQEWDEAHRRTIAALFERGVLKT
jgi:ferredoxin